MVKITGHVVWFIMVYRTKYLVWRLEQPSRASIAADAVTLAHKPLK